jgi:hypothetical protein
VSLPWGDLGLRIMPVQDFMDFNPKLEILKQEFKKLEIIFLDEYEQLIEQAKINLGQAFDPLDYKEKNELKIKLNLAISAVGEVDEKVSKLSDMILESFKSYQVSLMDSLLNRIKENVNNLKVLEDPKKIFRDSLLKNFKSELEILRKLNILEDARIEKIINELNKINLEGDLRNDLTLRSEIVGGLGSIEADIAKLF